MKTDPKKILLESWGLLTEVPGWPDAPARARVRRAVPIVIPFAGILLLVAWHLFVYAPTAREQQAGLQPLIALESEISSLQLACSAQQVADLVASEETARRLLLESPAELAPLLRGLKKEAADRGWNATLHAADVSADPIVEGALVTYLPVRAKLSPVAGNPDPFNKLIAYLERLTASAKRIDLIRVGIRADGAKGPAVELNFRLVSAVVHEKTP